MQSEKVRLFSLAAVVVAAVLFGMVIAGALNVTPYAGADRPPEAAPAAPASTDGFAPTDFVTLAERVLPSVVSVFKKDIEDRAERRERQQRQPFYHFFGPQDEGDDDGTIVRESSGSGFFISASGEVLTNNHVVENADRIDIELADGSRYEMELVGRDPSTDVALLRVKDPDCEFPYVSLGDSDGLKVGEWVMAVGNPLNLDHTVTVGVVSAMGRAIGLIDSSFEDFIQTDAAINFGNSGGPLVNLRAEAVGIATAINLRGQNLGFAIPISMVKGILSQLREHGEVVRGYLGISIDNVSQEIQEAFDLAERRGAFVQRVIPDHAADKAGLEHGDVIMEVDSEPVTDTRDLIDRISALPPDTEVELSVIRNGKELKISAKLEARNRNEDDSAAEDSEVDPSNHAMERAGLTVSGLTARIRQYYQLDEDIAGVVITGVRADSPAGYDRLRSGDIITEANGQKITSPSEFSDVIQLVEADGYLRLYVFRPRTNTSRFAILKLGE